MGEAFFVIGLIGFLVLPFLFLTGKGRMFWIITMGTIGVWIGMMEIVAKYGGGDGNTISRYFWEWSLNHEGTAWLVIGLLQIGWLILLVHLIWKVLKRRFDK